MALWCEIRSILWGKNKQDPVQMQDCAINTAQHGSQRDSTNLLPNKLMCAVVVMYAIILTCSQVTNMSLSSKNKWGSVHYYRYIYSVQPGKIGKHHNSITHNGFVQEE